MELVTRIPHPSHSLKKYSFTFAILFKKLPNDFHLPTMIIFLSLSISASLSHTHTHTHMPQNVGHKNSFSLSRVPSTLLSPSLKHTLTYQYAAPQMTTCKHTWNLAACMVCSTNRTIIDESSSRDRMFMAPFRVVFRRNLRLVSRSCLLTTLVQNSVLGSVTNLNRIYAFVRALLDSLAVTNVIS